MPVGPKPKSSTLRLLEGNPGKRPINDAEPQAAPIANLNPPSELDRYGKLAWRRNAPKLAKMGLLADADADMLMLYCDAYSQWRHSLDGMAALNGRTMPATESADEKQELVKDILRAHRDYLITREKARADMRLLAAELGLSASSRSRLKVTPQEQEIDPMADMLSGRRSG